MSVQGVMWGTETGMGRRPTLAAVARTGCPLHPSSAWLCIPTCLSRNPDPS